MSYHICLLQKARAAFKSSPQLQSTYLARGRLVLNPHKGLVTCADRGLDGPASGKRAPRVPGPGAHVTRISSPRDGVGAIHALQGYLADEKHHPRRTLQQPYV